MAVLYLTEKAPATEADLLKNNLFKDYSDDELKECWKDYLFFVTNRYLGPEAFSYPVLDLLNATSTSWVSDYTAQLLTAISCRHFK